MSTRRQQFIIVGLGEILWDMLASGKQLGGAPANFAYHATALGGKGFIVSSIGTDTLGDEMIALLDEIGLAHTYITRDVEYPTGTVFVKLTESGSPSYQIHENVAWDYIYYNDEFAKLAQVANAVCFGSLAQRSAISRSTIQNFLKATRPDCLRVFDINLRQTYYAKEVIAQSLSMANVFKLNDEELPIVADLFNIKGSVRDVIRTIMQRFSLHAIALTRGCNGSILCTEKSYIEHKGYKVGHICDTVGAGDAFTAALVMGLLKSNGAEEICNHANALASYICSQPGATPVISKDYPMF